MTAVKYNDSVSTTEVRETIRGKTCLNTCWFRSGRKHTQVFIFNLKMGFMMSLRGILTYIGQFFSIRHYQALCMVVIAAVAGALLTEGRPRMDSGHFYGMVHVGGLAACLGAQLWVILIGGMTMFFILPRHLFGKLQAFLFPAFFLWCLLSSGLALVTFSRPGHQAWDRTHWLQMICLLTSFVCASINSVVLAPLIIESMLKTFQFEVEVGCGHIVGHAVIKELAQNPDYVRSYSKFRRCHSGSAILNLVSLLANMVYLHYLVSRLIVVQQPIVSLH